MGRHFKIFIISVNGWEPTFLIRAFGLSEELSTEVGFAFSNNCLKSQDLRFGMKTNYMIFLIMLHVFRFGLGMVTTHLIYHCSKCLFHTKIILLIMHYTMQTQVLSFFHVEKTYRALVCQMCGNYSKIKS